MVRAVLTPILLLAVLVQVAFGCCARHSHEPIARTKTNVTVSADHQHGHGHSHRHGGHDHGPPPAHFHLGGDGGEEHEHDESGSDSYTYLVSRVVSAPATDFGWIDYATVAGADHIGSSVERAVRREGFDLSGRSGWPSGQRRSLLGVWLI